MTPKILAIIGARSGSQGLPDKNIHPFAGKPLIAHTIEAALKSEYINRVIVSTDSEKYAEISRSFGADVPFLRPTEISDSKATLGSYLKHAVHWLKENEKQEFDFIVSLPPTSPLRTTHQINEAIEVFLAKKTSFQTTLVSVYRAPTKAGWLMKKTDFDHISFCLDINDKPLQRQFLPELYFPNGAIKICHNSNIQDDFYGKETLFYEMSPESSADIDTKEELIQAESILVSK
jgi:CMP-N,N'-diacetyllegionaminic acid synthase